MNQDIEYLSLCKECGVYLCDRCANYKHFIGPGEDLTAPIPEEFESDEVRFAAINCVTIGDWFVKGGQSFIVVDVYHKKTIPHTVILSNDEGLRRLKIEELLDYTPTYTQNILR